MFLDFHKLREQPFGETPDPRYMYLSPTHREAIASLAYGIGQGRGFLVLVAEPGMGKTTVLFHLLEWLRESARARTVFLFQTQLGSRELLRYLLTDLGIEAEGKELGWMHKQLNDLLIREAEAGRRVVVFIDEAQNLKEPVLEAVRLLSDFENPRSKLIQIVLAGQPQLADKLARSELAQLRQRVSVWSWLAPFTPWETEAYISHRLSVAGAGGRQLFTSEACGMIAAWSRGIPRNINNLCFSALGLGFALGKHEIDCTVIQEAASDLKMAPVLSEPFDSQRSCAFFTGSDTAAPSLHEAPSSQQEISLGSELVPSTEFAPLGTSRDPWRKNVTSRAWWRTLALGGSVLVGFLMFGEAGILFLYHVMAQPDHVMAQSTIVKSVPIPTLLQKTGQSPKRVENSTDPASSSRLQANEPKEKSARGAKDLGDKPRETSVIPPSSDRLDAEPDAIAEHESIPPPSIAVQGKSTDAQGEPVEPQDLTQIRSGSVSVSFNVYPSIRLPVELKSQAVVARLQIAQLISRVDPIYPENAELQRIEGTVKLHAIIGRDGGVQSIEVTSGPPLLVPAAVSAIRQWRYKSTLLGDQPIETGEDITIVFRLAKETAAAH